MHQRHFELKNTCSLLLRSSLTSREQCQLSMMFAIATNVTGKCIVWTADSGCIRKDAHASSNAMCLLKATDACLRLASLVVYKPSSFTLYRSCQL